MTLDTCLSLACHLQYSSCKGHPDEHAVHNLLLLMSVCVQVSAAPAARAQKYLHERMQMHLTIFNCEANYADA